MATKARLTAEDLWQMPDDGVPRELVNGEIIEMPLPAPPHGRLVSLISYYLVDHVKEHGGGEVVAGDVRLILNLSYDPERVRGADVAFISTERLPGGKLPEKFLPGAPDLVVEVLSPSNTSIEIQQKVRDFLEAGARLVWVLAHQARSATVYRADGTARLLRENDVLDGENVLPGLRIPLEELFR
jgi:Uma2 family endonuclease